MVLVIELRSAECKASALTLYSLATSLKPISQMKKLEQAIGGRC